MLSRLFFCFATAAVTVEVFVVLFCALLQLSLLLPLHWQHYEPLNRVVNGGRSTLLRKKEEDSLQPSFTILLLYSIIRKFHLKLGKLNKSIERV